MWGGAIAWVLVYAWLTRRLFMDDAWTGLTYARNVWEGAGYVFFPGQPPVEGTTNLLWTLALVPLGGLLSFPVAAKVLGLVCIGGTLGLTRRLAVPLAHPGWSWVPVGWLLVCGDFLYFSLSGMETAGLALVLLAMAVWERQAWWLGVLAFLLHPEAVLVWPLAALGRWREGWPLLREGLGFGGLLALVAIARQMYFGFWLPNTFVAKFSDGSTVATNLVKLVLGQNTNFLVPLVWVWPLTLGLMVWGARCLYDQSPRWAWMLGAQAATAGLFGVYTGFDWTGYARYSAPYLPAIFVLLGYAWAHLSQNFGPPLRQGAIALAVLLAVVLFYREGQMLQLQTLRRYPGYVWASEALIAPAQWLASQLPPGTTIATRRIGALSYWSRQRVFDYRFGLTEPLVAQAARQNRRWFETPNDPAVLPLWQPIRPDALLEDQAVVDYMAQWPPNAGFSGGLMLGGVPYRKMRSFPIGTDRGQTQNWVLLVRDDRLPGFSSPPS
ncbi:MAG: hypothetical protein ACUVSQ_02445 [Pseudanabaenaceae cyanobacterium]